jgi:hypothetical protein
LADEEKDEEDVAAAAGLMDPASALRCVGQGWLWSEV